MSLARVLGFGALVLLAGSAGALYLSYRLAMGEAERAWTEISGRAHSSGDVFVTTLVAGLPEIAQRYFLHAIAPGTPLSTTVELSMRGTFLLGNAGNVQSYGMEARQILSPPSEFVWIPELRSGPMRITGSDALVAGRAWTRFWLNWLIPVANGQTSPDLVRSAVFRSAVEAIWVPAALLPRPGIVWEQVGADAARVTITASEFPVVLDMILGADGSVREVKGQRWSNANPEAVFRLQPFGGTIEAEGSFAGYTIPARVKVGNLFGTPDYAPFFQAEIVSARYL